MCYYWTAKYLCGCICDDQFLLCPSRQYCYGTALTQTEYEDDMCWQCRETAEQRTRLAELVRELELGSPLLDTVPSEGKGEGRGDGDKLGTGKEGDTDKRKDCDRLNRIICDVARVCDPVTFKRGRRRVRRACFDAME